MPVRDRAADACPGALATHTAADGELARVRVPGGRLPAERLRALAHAADEFGDGVLQLTSRANVQVRGLIDVDGFAARLDAAGLLGPPSHERVRNVLASPLSGVAGGVMDVSAMVPELDAAICASAALAELPGRFLFGLDDGRGDIADPADDRVDVCWRGIDADDGVVLLAGRSTELLVRRRDAVAALVAVAEEFLQVRGDEWQVRELSEPALEALRVVVQRCGRRAERSVQHVLRTEGAVRLAGVHDQPDGRHAVVAGVRFGALTAAQATLLAESADRVILTPWHTVVVPDLDKPSTARSLSDAGLLLDPHARQLNVSACIGAPGCAKSNADVRADATRLRPQPTVQAHFAGCERRCGRPSSAVDVLADESGNRGYWVEGVWVPVERLAEALSSPPRPPDHPPPEDSWLTT